MYVGKRFASPIKQGPRQKRAKHREEQKLLFSNSLTSPDRSSGETALSSTSAVSTGTSTPPPLHTTLVGQQLLANDSYEILELPSETPPHEHNTDPTVNAALLARIEFLEAENTQLLKATQHTRNELRIEDIQENDKLVRFFTGFASYTMFSAFFEFLGPAVHELNYRGEKEGARKRKRVRKLDPKNQLFLTLIKLKLNFQFKYLALRFGLSMSQASRYFTT